MQDAWPVLDIKFLKYGRGWLPAQLDGHDSQIDQLAVSPDGARLYSASANCIRVWATSDGAPLFTINCDGDGTIFLNSFALSPDGTTIYTYLGDHEVPNGCAYSATDGTALPVVLDGSDVQPNAEESFNDGGQCMAVSPDGRRVYAGGVGAVHVWSAVDGSRLPSIVNPNFGSNIPFAVSPRDGMVFAGSGEEAWQADFHIVGYTVTADNAHTVAMQFRHGVLGDGVTLQLGDGHHLHSCHVIELALSQGGDCLHAAVQVRAGHRGGPPSQ